MNTLARVCAPVCALILAVELPAQVATSTSNTTAAVSASTKTMADALKLRGEMAGTVANSSEKPDAAIARLKASTVPSGLNIDHDADFAFAAIDVGQRLIAAGKPVEAESFFLEAEKSLALVVGKTPDTSARDKAMFLQKLAWIRRRFLNEATQAMTDIDQAIALQPDNHDLQKTKVILGNENAVIFAGQPKG